MDDVTAVAGCDALMEEHLGPARRDLGWQGSGGHWVRPHPTQWVLLGWQKSTSSSAVDAQFTCNVKVIAKDEWDAVDVPPSRVPARPSTSTF